MEEYTEAMEVEVISATEETSKMSNSSESNSKLFNTNSLQTPEIQIMDSRYENRGGTFTTGIDIFSKEEMIKMEERAKRFGLIDKLKNNISNPEQDLYTSMGIVEENENTKNVRLNVIHMRGTEDMSTKDVFKYFEDYAPASIEWINDVSCNVVWLDNVSAARAMLGLSKRITGLGDKPGEKETKVNSTEVDEEKNAVNTESSSELDMQTEVCEETKDEGQNDHISIKDISYPLPPGIWRKGIDYPKSKGIFLRFATRSDKKQPHAEKMSEYYKKYGNPNFGGVKGILTESRKRMYKQKKRKLVDEPEETTNDRKRAKNPWGALSESWGLNDAVEDVFVRNDQPEQGRSIKERLGTKLPQKEPEPTKEPSEYSESSDSEDDWCRKSKVLRMRMHADDEEEKIHKRRVKAQQDTILSTSSNTKDLRLRLGRSRREPQFREAIQIVVTNPKASRNPPKADVSEEEDGEIVEEDENQEKEEGEWCRSDEEREEENAEEEQSDDESDEPAREVQGPKGSVIKVVQHKPRVASTVWARLNNVQSDVIDSTVKDRQSKTRDLRNTLRGGDLRSRIGNHTRGRSPLRIEVKNDKYMEDGSESE